MMQPEVGEAVGHFVEAGFNSSKGQRAAKGVKDENEKSGKGPLGTTAQHIEFW